MRESGAWRNGREKDEDNEGTRPRVELAPKGVSTCSVWHGAMSWALIDAWLISSIRKTMYELPSAVNCTICRAVIISSGAITSLLSLQRIGAIVLESDSEFSWKSIERSWEKRKRRSFQKATRREKLSYKHRWTAQTTLLHCAVTMLHFEVERFTKTRSRWQLNLTINRDSDENNGRNWQCLFASNWEKLSGGVFFVQVKNKFRTCTREI